MSTSDTEPRFGASALVTIDVQVDVLDGGPMEVAGTSAAVPAVASLAGAFRAAGLPIVHVVRIYGPDGDDVDRVRRPVVRSGAPILRPGSVGAEPAPGIVAAGAPLLDAPRLLAGGVQELGRAEVALWKPRWGAFFRTPLHEHLAGLGVSTLVFCGCNFPNCPRTSIYEASERDYRVVLATDAVSGAYDRGLDELAGIGVVLMTTAEIAAAVGATGATIPTP